MKPFSPQLLSILRMVVGFLFIQEGTMKMFGWPMHMPAGMHFVLFSQLGAAAVLEVVGGALILLGLFTRPVAFVLAGEMAVAYFQAHQPQGTWPLVNQGLPAVLFCFVFLYLAAAGAGPWSLDRTLRHVD